MQTQHACKQLWRLVIPDGAVGSAEDHFDLFNGSSLGGEIVTNGTFTGNADGWALGAGWAYDANNVTATAASGILIQTYSSGVLVNGESYIVTYTISGYVDGTYRAQLYGASQFGAGSDRTANGTYTEVITIDTTSTASDRFRITTVVDGTATVDDISVKRVIPATGRIVISSAKAIPAGDVAISGAVGVLLHLHKTTSIGWFGTEATTQGASNIAATFSTVTPAPGALPAGVTARLKPTGGATAGAWLSQTSVFTEETSLATYMEKWLHHPSQEPILLNAGEGIKVIQGAVAGAGSVGFMVEFGILEQ